MDRYLINSIDICNKIIGLFEVEYQELYRNLQGDLYDEYKLLMLEEIERAKTIKEMLIQLK